MLNHATILLSALALSVFADGCAFRNSEADLSQVQQSSAIKTIPLLDEEITATIATEMARKCTPLYASQDKELNSCKRAATRMAEALDFNYVRRNDGVGAFVFMHRRLKEMLADNEVLELIGKLTVAAENALYFNKHLDLWNFVLENSSHRPDVATERLAVLIQDGAETAAQIKYLLVSQHPQALQLAQMISTLEEALKQGKASAYPGNIELKRTALYHYYVPRYLAQKIASEGIEAQMAARLPFMFNSSYELHQIQKSQNSDLSLNHKRVRYIDNSSPELRRFIDKWNAYDELYSDLLDHLTAPFEAFDVRGQEFNMQDLFLGYRGGIDGILGHKQLPIGFLEFSQRFPSNPMLFIKGK